MSDNGRLGTVTIGSFRNGLRTLVTEMRANPCADSAFANYLFWWFSYCKAEEYEEQHFTSFVALRLIVQAYEDLCIGIDETIAEARQRITSIMDAQWLPPLLSLANPDEELVRQRVIETLVHVTEGAMMARGDPFGLSAYANAQKCAMNQALWEFGFCHFADLKGWADASLKRDFQRTFGTTELAWNYMRQSLTLSGEGGEAVFRFDLADTTGRSLEMREVTRGSYLQVLQMIAELESNWPGEPKKGGFFSFLGRG